MSIRPGPLAQSSKRHLLQDQDPCVDDFKRQRPNIDKSIQELTYSGVTESPGSNFTLDEILRSTNTDNVEFSQSSLDPSPREPQDPYDDDLFDDLELNQCLEGLIGFIPTGGSGPSPHLDDIDEFDLKQSDEDALEELLKQDTWQEPQQPPSSVLRTLSRNSQSVDEYDPQLQRSSPHSSSHIPGSSIRYALLPEEIDWRAVREHTRREPKPVSTIGASTANRSKIPEHESRTVEQKTWIVSQSRSSPPTKTHTSSVFTGQLLLRPFKTFFDLQELLDAKAQMFRNQPDVIFELFARVVYSSRENFHKKQYFRFRSLLKECPPYFNGSLLG
ncbi:unnamed protein product [Fusarium venenatum]|uniref:Uncharacterized protein n=1 Tax=Fusarium venenatum TaxID=56646 RepID=A0A2L2SVV1_9HYPO|nr:uncharacterized protein FVRRES_05164 [Fusarium venenatum]KAH6992281.1 hypothetical protein EDB82DRAFT_523384 [Fusarium venenatum]CEI60728.1 unnamed protein product [Fusarium venenatum]